MSITTLGRTVRAVRRAAVALCVAALASSQLATASATPHAGADPDGMIDTYAQWDGAGFVLALGHPQLATLGQVITIPEGEHSVRWLRFWLAGDEGGGTMRFRGAIYTWDGKKAGEKVWESRRQEHDFYDFDPTFYPVTVKAEGAAVEPGEQYVVFLTVSRDFRRTTPGVSTRVAAVLDDVLPGGAPYYLDNRRDTDAWTAERWEEYLGYDLAMQIKLR